MSTKEIASQDDVNHHAQQRLETLHEGCTDIHPGCPFRDAPGECSAGCSIERDTGITCTEYQFMTLEEALESENLLVKGYAQCHDLHVRYLWEKEAGQTPVFILRTFTNMAGKIAHEVSILSKPVKQSWQRFVRWYAANFDC